MNRRIPKRISTSQRIILVISGLFLCIVLLEIGLRVGGFVLLSLQEYRNTISLRQKGEYRIMCLGESTTALGGEYAYPRQLEKILNQRGIGIEFSVINKGIPGTNTGVMLSQLEDNLNKYAPDMVIAMMGIGDGWYLIIYKASLAKKTTTLLNSLRTYKLLKLLKLHIINRAREAGLYKPRESKERIATRIDVSIQPNRIKEQENILTKAIEAEPNNSNAYAKLGWIYLTKGEIDNAEGMLKKAIEMNPDNSDAYAKLGWIYLRKREFDTAEGMLKKAIEADFIDDRLYGTLAQCYQESGRHKLAEEYFRQADRLRLEYYNPVTKRNYQRLKQILNKRGIKLVCVQYPVRSIEPLKRMFEDREGIIFVDNEKIFKEALKQAGYDEYFMDMFAGNFGHCTAKGNRLLAENIANVILKECFDIKQYIAGRD